MKIAKQGWKLIFYGLVAAQLGFLPIWGPWGPVAWPPVVLGLGFACFCAYFFRDPERPLPSNPNRLYSPGDGRVLSVAREAPDAGWTARIFLSIFDVHVQRVPCSGTIEKTEYLPGAFAMAMKPEAMKNERSIIHIRPDGGRPPVIVEQIAGFVARRIETWPKEGDAVRSGARYGIIYFGSQAAVHLPQGARPLVKPGDRVIGGVTEIAEWIG